MRYSVGYYHMGGSITVKVFRNSGSGWQFVASATANDVPEGMVWAREQGYTS